MSPSSFDYVIVGGGLAGIVIAARLSEDENHSVLVIEAGEDQASDDRVNIPGMWLTLANTSSSYVWKTVPQEGLNGREVEVMQGRMLAGSTGLNGLNFAVTSEYNVNAWESLGNAGWGWTEFQKSMQKAYTPASSDQEDGGPIKLSTPDEKTNWARAWQSTLATLGYKTDNDPYSGKVNGALVLPDTVDPKTAQRSYTRTAYLKERPNCTVWTKAQAQKVLFDKAPGLRASGIQVTRNGSTDIATARKDVIIAAGTIHSPQILEASGIGNTHRLAALNIDTVIDLPGVGENLQNHPLSGLCFETKDEPGYDTLDNLSRQEPDAVGAAMTAYAQGKGPLAMSNANHVAQLPTPPGPKGKVDYTQTSSSGASTVADTEFTGASFAERHEAYARSVVSSETEASAQYMSFAGFAFYRPDGSFSPPPSTGKFFTIAMMLSHPLSRGSVHLAGSGSDASVAIDPGYLSNPLDVEIMARHLQFMERIANTEPLASHLKLDGHRNPGAPAPGAMADLEVAKDYARTSAVGASHYTGTCSMMPRELGGVVDPQLRVYGCRNLRVCDASIIPLVPRANPMASVYGVAEHAAKIISSSG